MIGYKQYHHPTTAAMEFILKTCGLYTAKVIASELLLQLKKSKPLRPTAIPKWLNTQHVLHQIIHDLDNIDEVHQLVRDNLSTCCALRPVWDDL